MRAAIRLFQAPGRIVLFTRQTCGLCDKAKVVINNVRQSRPFEYKQIDVMTSGQTKWKDMYELDVPVIHIQPATEPLDPDSADPKTLRKLMHRFTEKDVEGAMNELDLE